MRLLQRKTKTGQKKARFFVRERDRGGKEEEEDRRKGGEERRGNERKGEEARVFELKICFKCLSDRDVKHMRFADFLVCRDATLRQM